jgi:hypothetical protein
MDAKTLEITVFQLNFWTSADVLGSVRSDSPFTKRSGDMVYNSWLD